MQQLHYSPSFFTPYHMISSRPVYMPKAACNRPEQSMVWATLQQLITDTDYQQIAVVPAGLSPVVMSWFVFASSHSYC